MSADANDVILHNYPQSPVAEKVRVAFGIKGINWRNVEIPRLPPKPMLTPLTGGYRRTPVMQIGADIYCDSQCIIRELERRFPSPSFMPTTDAGLLWCLSRWTDGALFELAVKIVLGAGLDSLPQEFAEDRGRLYLGEDWAEGLRQANKELAHLIAQFNTSLLWLNQQLDDGRKFLTGPDAAAIDAQIYHVMWFVHGRWEGGPGLIGQYANVARWMDTVKALGHGQQSDLSAEDALSIAKTATTSTAVFIDSNDPQALQEGQRVSIKPDVNGGEQAVHGNVRLANVETIAIDRISELVGDVCVHFPRSGYRVETV